MNWRGIFQPEAARRAALSGVRFPSLKFWAVNALILGAFYFLVVQPVRDAIAAGEELLVERRATLARYASVAAQGGAIENYAKRIADGNARGELIAGENDGIVAANLQARLKAVADSAKVSVRSLQMLPSKTIQNAVLVGARLEVSGPLAEVHALARDLESSAPLLIVAEADLRSQIIWGGAADNEPGIDARFDVFGGAVTRTPP